MKILLTICSLSLVFSLIYSCSSNLDAIEAESLNISTNSHLIIRLTDAPGDFEQVNVDLLQLQIKNSEGWQSLESFEPGIYDLLQLQNGVEEVLVDEMFFNDDVTEIRLILGPENTVVVDGETFDLKTPSAQNTGIKVKVEGFLAEGDDFSILLDFDAHKSVISVNDSYLLKPVIKATMPDGTEVEGEEDEGDDNGDQNDEGDDDSGNDNGSDDDDDGAGNDDDDGSEPDDDGDENGENDNKITVCHIPPGNPDNPQTISISESSWPAHEAHGDTIGECESDGNDDDQDEGN